jgi:hypothetical protein
MLNFEVRRKGSGGVFKILTFLRTKDNDKEPKPKSDSFEVTTISKER